VSVLYAGSLVSVMERTIVPALAKQGLIVQGEAKGSVALANLIKGGLRSPDVFVSADPKVIDGLVSATPKPFSTWYVTFATTRLVIGYSPKSAFAADFVKASRGEKKLTDVLLQSGLRIGRTDPALDPKGYRSIIVAKLIESEEKLPGFADKLLGEARNPDQVFPEETLLVRLESGELDAAFLYATESVSRILPAIELPPAANLGDPSLASTYATASVTIDGVTRTGGPASYALTVLSAAPNPDGAVKFAAYFFSSAGRSAPASRSSSRGSAAMRPRFPRRCARRLRRSANGAR
jgi:molybdate/tungstate transport system substrate-binding protein